MNFNGRVRLPRLYTSNRLVSIVGLLASLFLLPLQAVLAASPTPNISFKGTSHASWEDFDWYTRHTLDRTAAGEFIKQFAAEPHRVPKPSLDPRQAYIGAAALKEGGLVFIHCPKLSVFKRIKGVAGNSLILVNNILHNFERSVDSLKFNRLFHKDTTYLSENDCFLSGAPIMYTLALAPTLKMSDKARSKGFALATAMFVAGMSIPISLHYGTEALAESGIRGLEALGSVDEVASLAALTLTVVKSKALILLVKAYMAAKLKGVGFRMRDFYSQEFSTQFNAMGFKSFQEEVEVLEAQVKESLLRDQKLEEFDRLIESINTKSEVSQSEELFKSLLKVKGKFGVDELRSNLNGLLLNLKKSPEERKKFEKKYKRYLKSLSSNSESYVSFLTDMAQNHVPALMDQWKEYSQLSREYFVRFADAFNSRYVGQSDGSRLSEEQLKAGLKIMAGVEVTGAAVMEEIGVFCQKKENLALCNELLPRELRERYTWLGRLLTQISRGLVCEELLEFFL